MPETISPKFRVIADELEAKIAAGEWPANHKLPSVRRLAEQYGVALATAVRALEVLHGKGIIRPHERSGAYRVVGLEAAATEHWAVCLRITPGPWQRASLAVSNSGFVEMAHSGEVRLDFEAIPTDLDLSEAVLRQHIRAARRAGITGLFFMPARINEEQKEQDERFLALCRELRFPVVLIERNLRGDQRPLEWDLVCPDDVDGGFLCAMHLFEHGRTRLAFVRGGPTSSHNDQLAGFLVAHFHARQRGLLAADAPFPLVLEYPEDSPSSKLAYRLLCDRVLAHNCEGVVCYHDRIAVGLAIELLARGLAVPNDIALTGFDDQPIGQEFAIGITTYAYPGVLLARRAFEIMRQRLKDPAAPPVKVIVPSRLIVRESTAATR